MRLGTYTAAVLAETARRLAKSARYYASRAAVARDRGHQSTADEYVDAARTARREAARLRARLTGN